MQMKPYTKSQKENLQLKLQMKFIEEYVDSVKVGKPNDINWEYFSHWEKIEIKKRLKKLGVDDD